MRRPIVTACVFCFFCCAHINCFSHNDNQIGANRKPIWTDNKADFIHKVFEKYGNGEIISLQGFERLLREIRLDSLILPHTHDSPVSHVKNSTSNSTQNLFNTPNGNDDLRLPQCISSESLMSGSLHLTPSMYRDVCPVLLSQLMPIALNISPHVCQHYHNHVPPDDTSAVWLYSTLSIIVISLCGLLGVAVIPVMQQVFYHKLLQFLVALAVGTLCGDALLHLLPHAMMATHSHSHMSHPEGESHMDDHDANIWRGLVAMLGVVFFYFTEKCLTMVAECRKKRQRKTQLMPKVRVMRDVDSPTSGTKVGEKLCKHKYSSYPYCYGEIAENPDNHQKLGDSTEASAVCKHMVSSNNKDGDGSLFEKKCLNAPDLTKENELMSTQKALLDANDGSQSDERYTVIIREHENTHHGHSHTHGHVHSAPQSMSSVAWMVIMGDGLHNFTDGMAIGAAFSSNITGGFSTALAVFCHELPHELGDFAVLLKAGMSAKQAVFYNMLSSILCFVGMCFGIFLGHDEHMTQWVFAAAAGMFLYIALVDMIPELTTSHSNEGGSLCQCVLHFAGLMTGIAIMLLIAIYEHDIKTVFNNK